MNRNAAILGLASSAVLALALGLAWSLRGATAKAASTAGTAASEPHEEPGSEDVHSLLLDRGSPGAEAERRTTGVTAPHVTPRADQPPPLADSGQASLAPDEDPLLVTGRVVDQDHGPVYAARVTVTHPLAHDLPGRSDFEATTDRQGRFEIRGIAGQFRPVLHAGKDGYFPAPERSFEWGASDVQLVLREGGVVAGRVQLDPWIPASRIRVIVEPIPPTGLLEPGRSLPFSSPPIVLDADGRFRFGGITASTAVVSVRIEHDPWTVARVEDVPVREGEAPQDPRLEPIDLRGKLEIVAVSVLDPSGARVDGARVLLSSSEDLDLGCSRVTTGGRAEFLTRTGPHDLDVEREGFRRQRLAGVYGDQVVRLRQGISVRVVLQGKSPDVKPPERIAIALLKGTRDRSTLGGMGTFVDPRQATVLVTSPGSYEIAWYLESGRDRKYITSSAGRTVEVSDLDGTQDVVVEFPTEALAALR